mgnify:FL=1|jgi:1-acyl-sn-glycerol-3-phosphate acyltransferase|tara:strand:- start:15 stop:719 length:705 start_codon:yes stop_codon:yes gene_type:complete
MKFIRSASFNAAFYLTLILFTSTIILLYPFLSTKNLQLYASKCIIFELYLLKIFCKVSWKVEGIENLPKTPCILVSNHQGQWESLFLQTLLVPSSSIVKKEILFIPFFGWAVYCMSPILLDRSNKLSSLKKVIKVGGEKIKSGFSIILFPEGTRVKPEDGIQFFSSSCGVLSVKNNVPIIPICHNSGIFWRNKEFIKQSGEITVRIGKPMKGADAKKLSNQAYEWISDNYKEIY